MTRTSIRICFVATLAAMLGCRDQAQLLPVAFVPGGNFRATLMCRPGIDRGCAFLDKRGPRGRVILWLGPFWADTTLVRREQFEACQNADVCTRPLNPTDDRWARPAMLAGVDAGFAFVPFEEAATYCRWRGWRLPTSDEYERMARWTDGRRFSWGSGLETLKNIRKASPEGIRELNFTDQWVAPPSGIAATMGDGDSAEISTPVFFGAAFRCVYTPPWDVPPGVGRIVDPAGDPWVEGGPDG